MASNAKQVYQYEQPRCPDNWNESERRFYSRLIQVLDDVYAKYGSIDEKMLSKSLVNKINNSGGSIDTITGIYNDATVDSLLVNELTAATARITELVAEKMVSDTIQAGTIAADTVQGTFAHFVSLSAKYGSFDFETVKSLVAEALVLEKGSADDVHIRNLSVVYGQILNATIGSLCIKASDGKYYTLDVGADGKVSASETQVSEEEADAGQTAGGKVILGTQIVAEDLNAQTIAATQALVNKIDAARIDVGTLIAREAFIQALTADKAFVSELMANEAFVNLLRTAKIVGDKSIEMIAETADSAKQEAEDAAIYEGMLPPPAPIPEGKLWLDRSTTPPVLKRWLGDADVPTDGSFTRTLTGNPVNTVGQAQRIDDVYCVFGPVQGGSGVPSPTNVRPISACSRFTLTRAGSSGASDTYTTEFSPIYGGSLDWITGKLTSDRGILTLTGAETWYDTYAANYGYYYTWFSNVDAGNVVCSHFASGDVPGGACVITAKYLRLNVYDLFKTKEELVTFLAGQNAAGTPVQVVHKVASATESQIAPVTISALAGVNTLRADENCTLSVTYTGTGWETVNDTATLQNAQDIIIAQQDALRREVDALNSYTKLDADGLWVGKQGATGQTLLKYDSVNIVVNGKPVAVFAGKYVEIGGMRMFVPNAGGLAFAPSGN